MKYRESGMPDENMWVSFFNPIDILRKLDVNKNIRTLLDIGCGYGTFLLPAAELVKNKAIGIDIDNEMIQTCRSKVNEGNIQNIELLQGDISTEKTINDLKLDRGNIDYICLFNILHCEAPMDLLTATYNLLVQNGKIGVIHWKYEDTPRGPSMEIRPTPEMIQKWATDAGFTLGKQIDLPPHHFGLVFIKE